MIVHKDKQIKICPICKWKGDKFLPKNGRIEVLCPRCESFERHRHQYLVSREEGLFNELPELDVLHVSPKNCEMEILSNARVYISLDKNKPNVNVRSILENLPFKALFFDIVWASHVLEHIQDVQAAISEIYRVLKIGGRAVFDVPMYGEKTVFLKKQDRFGHVWHPGSDWISLYEVCGFQVKQYVSLSYPSHFGLLVNAVVSVCKKNNI